MSALKGLGFNALAEVGFGDICNGVFEIRCRQSLDKGGLKCVFFVANGVFEMDEFVILKLVA